MGMLEREMKTRRCRLAGRTRLSMTVSPRQDGSVDA